MGSLGEGYRFSWDGYPGGQVRDSLPFAAPQDAQKWLVVSSVQTGAAAQSQCEFMRADPQGYLVQAVN
jgi:hypothetical protein